MVFQNYKIIRAQSLMSIRSNLVNKLDGWGFIFYAHFWSFRKIDVLFSLKQCHTCTGTLGHLYCNCTNRSKQAHNVYCACKVSFTLCFATNDHLQFQFAISSHVYKHSSKMKIAENSSKMAPQLKKKCRLTRTVFSWLLEKLGKVQLEKRKEI